MRSLEIINHFQTRLAKAKYGYAEAIRTGRAQINGRNLEFMAPPIRSVDEATFYACQSASQMLVREFTRAGLKSAAVNLFFPIKDLPKDGIEHQVVLVDEGGQANLVGLTLPLDRLLGLYPYQPYSDATTILSRATSHPFNPFENMSLNFLMAEAPSWDFFSFGNKTLPLFEYLLDENKLVETSLLFGRYVPGFYFAGLVTRILTYDPAGAQLLLVNQAQITFPVTKEILPQIIAAARNNSCAKFLEIVGLGELAERQQYAAAYTSEIDRSFENAWPTMAIFFEKINPLVQAQESLVI